MANNKKGDVNVDNDSDAVNSHSSYAKKTQSIERNFIASAQAQDQAAMQEISQKQIANPTEINNIRGRHHKKAKASAARMLNTLASPGSISSEVASLAHLEKTRKNVSGSSLMGMSDELLEGMYQQSIDQTSDYRNKAANSIRTARLGSGGTPQLNKSYYESITGGARGAQEAANIKAAINERRRTGVSNVKVESAIQETQNRRAAFTEDADLKRQISENKLSRKDVEARYEEDYSRFEKTKRGRSKLANRAEDLTSQRQMQSSALNEVVEAQVMMSGGNKSATDVIKENPALQAAQKSIENLDKQLESVGNAAAKADKELLGYNQSLSKQERLLKSMPKGGVGSFMEGGGGDAMVEAMGTAAQMFRRHMVGIPMREEKAKAGIANLALSRYNKQYAATQGDMASYYEIVQDAGGAEAFGKQMALRGQISSGIEAKVDATSAGIDVANIVLGGGASRGVNKGLAKGAKLMAKSMKGFAAIAKGADENSVIGAETKLEAILTKDQYNAAIAAMRSQGGQALYNQAMGAANVSVGAGDSKALEKKLSSVGGMQDALNRGNLSPEQFMQVTAQVGQSVYGSNQDRGEIAVRAGQMQKKRVMTTDQFTQAMGIQSAAGGSVSGLESTLKRAVAAGVNDSKLLVEFAQLSANLNQSLTDAGTSAENHTAYSNKVQQMREAGVSEVLATRAAASQIGKIDAMLQDTGVTEGSIIKAGMIEKMIPNADTSERLYMQNATSAEIGKIFQEDLTADEERSMLPAARSAREKAKAGAGGLAAGRAKAAEMVNFTAAANTGLASQYFLNKEETMKNVGAFNRLQVGPDGNLMSFNKGAGKEFTDQSGVAEGRTKDQGQAALNQIEQAAKALGGVEETFKAITESLKVITANLDANKAVEDAKKGAENLEASGKFSTAVGQFDEAVKTMRTKMGITPVSNLKNDNAKVIPSAQGLRDAAIKRQSNG